LQSVWVLGENILNKMESWSRTILPLLRGLMAKVLIIDKDIHTINSLSSFLAVFGIETMVVHNWPSHIKNFNPQSLTAVFVDVELRSVHLDKLHHSFNSESPESPPIFYLFSRTFAPRYVEAKEYPYKGDFKKPLQLADAFEQLKDILNLDKQNITSSDSNTKYVEFKSFRDEFTEWIKTMALVLDKTDAV